MTEEPTIAERIAQLRAELHELYKREQKQAGKIDRISREIAELQKSEYEGANIHSAKGAENES